MNVFLDTSIVNYILDLENERKDKIWQENIKYLKLLKKAGANGAMIFIVNPTVMWQINNVTDENRKEKLIAKSKEFAFEDFTLFFFPLTFPLFFPTPEQIQNIETICKKHPKLEDDKKIIADACFNENIDILLTVDKDLSGQEKIGKVKIMLPKQLWDYYESIQLHQCRDA